MSDQPPNRVADLNANITKVVQHLMLRDDLEQQDLAAKMGFHKSVITKAVRGQRKWQIDDLSKLAEVFDVPVSLFFEDAATLIRNRWNEVLVGAR